MLILFAGIYVSWGHSDSGAWWWWQRVMMRDSVAVALKEQEATYALCMYVCMCIMWSDLNLN